MEQRDFSSGSPVGQSRRRVLVEDPDRALLVSDFALFSESGLEVALCTGPSADEPCPLVEGRECQLASAADVVLMGPGMAGHSEEVAAALHRRHPALPVVVTVPRQGTGSAPEGCIPLPVPCSVEGQLRAVWRALDQAATRRPAPATPPPPARAAWPLDPSLPNRLDSGPSVPGRWPSDPSAPARSTALSATEARLVDLLGW